MDGIYRWEGIWVLMDSGISQHRVLIRSVHFEASTPMAFATFDRTVAPFSIARMSELIIGTRRKCQWFQDQVQVPSASVPVRHKCQRVGTNMHSIQAIQVQPGGNTEYLVMVE